MFFSYTLSVILLSLAIFGVWCLARDIWQWWLEPKLNRLPDCTFMILTRNQEDEIEELLRFFLQELEISDTECDTVVIDCGSTDMTPLILARLADANPLLTTVALSETSRPVGDLLPLCRGGLIHILDMTGRLSGREFLAAACALLKRQREGRCSSQA